MKSYIKEYEPQLNNFYSYSYKIRPNKISDNYCYNNYFDSNMNYKNRNLNIINLKQNNSFYNKLKYPQKTKSYISQYDKYFYPFLFSKKNEIRNNQNKKNSQYHNYSNNSYNIGNKYNIPHNDFLNDENQNNYSVNNIYKNESLNFGSYDNYFLGLTHQNNINNNNYEEENNKCEMNMQIISIENQDNNFNNNNDINNLIEQRQNMAIKNMDNENILYNTNGFLQNRKEENNKIGNSNSQEKNRNNINENKFNKLLNIDKLNKKIEIKKEPLNIIKKSKKKALKKLSFHEEENITIKYNQKDEITRILIFDSNNRLRKTKPRNINVYLSKLKGVKPKPVLMNSNSILKNKETMKKSNSASFMRFSMNKKNTILSNYCSNYLIDKYPLKQINKNFEIKKTTPKKEICERFKKNPQIFYTEELCDLVLKSLDLDISNEGEGLNEDRNKSPVNRNKNGRINKRKFNKLDKEIEIQAYYNLKKYFEKNNLDD